MRLKSKVAIITGGAEGIGQAYALGFAREGAKLVISDINYPAAQALVEKLKQQGCEALATKTDVSSITDTQKMAAVTLERFGKIDVLVNNAAMYQRQLAVRSFCWEMDPADFEKVIKVNVTGVFLCCRAVLPHMIKQKSGKIINIASSLAFQGAARLTHYAASKGAVVTFTRSLAREVGEYGINVNSLCPGFTLSADPASITEERRQYEVPSRILKRPQYPEDLVGSVIYLASSDSDFMTGQAVVVDGGVILH
jgi:NAD(P)-dependent dehydrogenase (short-subunit alcohol dehydrogenase family)